MCFEELRSWNKHTGRLVLKKASVQNIQLRSLPMATWYHSACVYCNNVIPSDSFKFNPINGFCSIISFLLSANTVHR
jgi:hypothetical protein